MTNRDSVPGGAVARVLAWAVSTGAAFAPHGTAGVALLAPPRRTAPPHAPPSCRVPDDAGDALPPDVRAALAVHWPAVLRALEDARTALAADGCPGGPAYAPAVLTVAAHAAQVRAMFTPAERARDAAQVDAWAASAPRWLARLFAVDAVRLGHAARAAAGVFALPPARARGRTRHGSRRPRARHLLPQLV